MSDLRGARMVLDSKNSWKNLPYAMLPAGVGVGLVAFPWVGVLDPWQTAPIMLPFGFLWLLLAVCINAYHSEVVLDEAEGAVIYRMSLFLHAWGNKAVRGNVSRVILRKESGSYRFVMELIEGEDITITTFDYWRSREWSENVAAFLNVSLVDECRDGEKTPSAALNASIRDQDFDVKPPENPPGGIEIEWETDTRALIILPPRGFLPSARPRLVMGALVLLLACLLVWFTDWNILSMVGGITTAAFLWIRPIGQATHKEEIGVSPRGVHLSITTFGRSRRASLTAREIRNVTVVKGNDARFERSEFDRHAVCLESIEGVDAHFQVGSHLPKLEHVEWLQQTLLYILTMPKRTPKTR